MAKKDSERLDQSIATNESTFDFYLIVVNPFDDFQKGQRISDDIEIQTILDAGNSINCNRIPR